MRGFTVPLVKVKGKYQVTLPASVRARVGVGVGDLLEAEVRGKKITLTPKIAVDRAFVEKRLAEGLADLKAGRVYGPFNSAREAVRSLQREAKRLKKR